jgi:hypothetical protein
MNASKAFVTQRILGRIRLVALAGVIFMFAFFTGSRLISGLSLNLARSIF